MIMCFMNVTSSLLQFAEVGSIPSISEETAREVTVAQICEYTSHSPGPGLNGWLVKIEGNPLRGRQCVTQTKKGE